MSTRLSVVIPVHNEAAHLSATLEALVEAVARSEFLADVVLVDDGSTDGSAGVARRALVERLPLEIVSQPNRGRFEARKAGLEAASAESVLLLDGRVRIVPEALGFVHGRILQGEEIWTAHVYVDVGRNPYGAFWNVLAEIAWREYFDNPRTTSFGSEDFDHYPKGTTCFFAPRRLLLDAIEGFRSYYAERRFVNDDTAVIRRLAERHRIHVSPSFAAVYSPRTTPAGFLRHALHRGTVFLDGHGKPESRFFPVAVAFFPLSIVLAVAALRRPAVIPVVWAASAGTAGAVAARAGRSRFETVSFGLLVPPYAVAHGLGMWRGAFMFAQSRFRAGAQPQPPPPTTAT